MTNTFNSFAQMLETLSDETACRNFLEKVRWNDIPVCPHCGVQNKEHYKLKSKGVFKGLYKCKDCRERFTVTVGTMFEGSHIPLRKWFIATYIFSSHKKGISSHQLSRDLGITQKSAWFILHRLRNTMMQKDNSKKLEGVVEADETFIGGKETNKHKTKLQREIGAVGNYVLNNKQAVAGVIQRKGEVRIENVKNATIENVEPFIFKNVKEGSKLMTDESVIYRNIGDSYPHKTVKHSSKVYVNGEAHTNSIENFWSLLKRGIYGIYHSTSPKHLNKYCGEFAYRFNTREIKDADRFTLSLINADGRLTYKQLIRK